MHRVLISDSIDKIAERIFKENDISFDVKTNLSENEIMEIIGDYNALVVRSATKVTKNIIDKSTNLKIIGRAGAGVDNIDIKSAKEKKILVMNTPGGNTNATAEHALTLILSLIRKIPYANLTTHNGSWEKKKIKGNELSKKTIGIIGFGNVSSRLIELLSGFGVNIIIYSNSLSSRKNHSLDDLKKIYNEKAISISSFDEIVEKSDIISLHSNATKDGQPLFDMKQFKKMKKNSFIINTARGNLINENDLNAALNENLISGAAIDVFSIEPAQQNILFNNKKIILTPHIAASTHESQIIVAEMISKQICDFLINNKIVNTV